jgi:hypothetical protein
MSGNQPRHGGFSSKPRDPLPKHREAWPPIALELFEERAGIVQADTGCSRGEAERLAEAVVRRAWAMAGDMPPHW